MTLGGTAHTFGDNVNTDYMTPTDYFNEPIEVIASHLFEPIDPEFGDRFEPGDVIVAGENFGSGSSRETAPKAIKTAGAKAVVAESFARIFYRNGIAIGLPVVTCPGVTDIVSQGDEIEIDLDDGVLENLTTGRTASVEPLPPSLQSIFEVGGLLEHLEEHPGGLRSE